MDGKDDSGENHQRTRKRAFIFSENTWIIMNRMWKEIWPSQCVSDGNRDILLKLKERKALL